VRNQTPGDVLQAIGAVVRHHVRMLRRRYIKIDAQITARFDLTELLLQLLFRGGKGKTSAHESLLKLKVLAKYAALCGIFQIRFFKEGLDIFIIKCSLFKILYR